MSGGPINWNVCDPVLLEAWRCGLTDKEALMKLSDHGLKSVSLKAIKNRKKQLGVQKYQRPVDVLSRLIDTSGDVSRIVDPQERRLLRYHMHNFEKSFSKLRDPQRLDHTDLIRIVALGRFNTQPHEFTSLRNFLKSCHVARIKPKEDMSRGSFEKNDPQREFETMTPKSNARSCEVADEGTHSICGDTPDYPVHWCRPFVGPDSGIECISTEGRDHSHNEVGNHFAAEGPSPAETLPSPPSIGQSLHSEDYFYSECFPEWAYSIDFLATPDLRPPTPQLGMPVDFSAIEPVLQPGASPGELERDLESPTQPAIERLTHCSAEGCPGTFRTRKGLLRHARAQHCGPAHVCPFKNCSRKGRPFTRSDNLKDHIRRVHHTDHKPAIRIASTNPSAEIDELRQRISELEKSMGTKSATVAETPNNIPLQWGALSDQEFGPRFVEFEEPWE
ncbi:MAG: hypothetical protein M1839_004514 [Geoglossum umbratile]|nr:MAG: hypothetical protein M1839_004514 [Geoglossum umbratile]